MDINFTSVEELYKRVYPALRSKVKEFKRNDINYIKEEDGYKVIISEGNISNEIIFKNNLLSRRSWPSLCVSPVFVFS